MRAHAIAAITFAAASLAACGGEGSPDASLTEALATSAAAVSQDATLCVLNTELSPENEVRTAANTTDPTVESTARGHAQVKVRADGTIEYKVFVLNQDGETFTAGHIHGAPAGTNGPVVQNLFVGSTFDDEQFVQHDEVSNPALAADLCADPSAYYVNYHTTQDPVGAIRGQL